MAASVPVPPAASRPKNSVLLVVTLGLLAVGLRLWHLNSQSATMDEVAELFLVSRTATEIIHTQDGFPPLYHLLLKGWLAVLGPDTARWLSVLCGLALIPVIWHLGKLIGGTRTAWIAAFLAAISPVHVWYAQEARANVLFYFLVVSAVYFFFRVMEEARRRDWMWYGVTALLGLYTHYYFSLVIAGLLATVPLFPGARRGFPALVRVHLLLAFLSLPWIWLLIPDLGLQSGYAAPHVPLNLKAIGYTLVTFLFGFSVGPSLRELHVSRSGETLLQAIPWAIAAVAVCLLALLAGWRDLASRRWALRLGIVILVPIVVCGLAAASLDLGFRVRYVAWGASLLLVLLAAGIARGGRAAVVSAGLLVSLSLVSLTNRFWNPRYSNEDTRSAARYLATVSSSSTPVFVTSGYMAGALAYYLVEPWHPRALPDLAGSGPGTALEEIKSEAGAGQSFWLVYSRPWDGDPGGRLRDQLESTASLQLRAEWPGVQLYEGRGW